MRNLTSLLSQSNLLSRFAIGAVALTFNTAIAREDFVQLDGKWRYHNGEVKPPENWKETDFDDSKWFSGQAPLGYGNYQLRTKVRSTKSPRPLATYFRTSFIVDDPSDWERLKLKFKADDGAIVYLNGKWISAFNMPGSGTDETATPVKTIKHWSPYKDEYLPDSILGYLVKGKNTIALSAHQINPSSSDLNVSLSLTGVEKGIQTKELLNLDSDWKYSDQRTLPDNDWLRLEYDDSAWKTGKGVFGYGNPDLNTIIDFGGDPSNKPNCTWFRKEFMIEDHMDVRALRFRYRYDDALIFFLNGKEINRDTLPFGYVDHHTPASVEIREWGFTNIKRFDYPAQGLRPGKNLIAVQIHSATPQTPDLCFAMNSLSLEYLPRDPKSAPVVKNVPDKKEEKTVVKVTNPEAVAAASSSDWLYSSNKYHELALSSYANGKLDAARRAYCAARWARLFAGEASTLNAEIKHFLLAQENLSTAQEFLDIYSDYDDHDRVYDILNTLFETSSESFKTHANLAMAIAVVYDQDPPRYWPHHQVGVTILPRRLPSPSEAFSFWVTSDNEGKSLHSLKSLGIGELKFVIDTPATLEELKEAQNLRVRFSNIKDLYPAIEYSQSRLKQRIYDWPYQDYSLKNIKKVGGICVDQAYYTIQVSKAFGVPSMMVSGAGSNGNHAWVGFLPQRERWDFETGRYEESKYVTGETFDPQTWQRLTDHEISLLTERFQSSPRFQISKVHAIFANEYLKLGNTEVAIKASKLAIKSEPRNFAAWDFLVRASKQAKSSPEELHDIYEKGAKTFSRIADLEAHFLKRQATNLNQNGKTAEADKIRDRIISRNRRERPDLALQESKIELEKLIHESSIDEQVAFYRQQVLKLKDAGLITYYALTQPFLEHLVDEERADLALKALEYTERRMDIREGSQLEGELNNWKSELGGQ